MTTIYEESEWWYKTRVIDFSSYRKYSHSCKYVNGFSYYMTATVPFTSNVIQMNISENMSEILMFVKFLHCPDVNTLFVTHIKGRQCNRADHHSFDMKTIDKDISEDVMTCMNIMFRDLKFDIVLYTPEEFQKRRNVYRNVLSSQISVLPLPKSVLACIAQYMRPNWYDYDHADMINDISDDYFDEDSD